MKRICFLILICFLFINYVYADSVEITNIECIDGDTLKADIDGETKTIRLLAIDTPETKYATKEEDEPYSVEAMEWTCKRLNEASQILLEYDPKSDETDKYGRVLGWLFVDGSLLQSELIQKGYAKVEYVYDEYKYVSTLKEEESAAKENKLGIWSDYDEEPDDTMEMINKLIDKLLEYIEEKGKLLIDYIWKLLKNIFKTITTK